MSVTNRKAGDGSPDGPVRCVIYLRKSHRHNLQLEFNSLDAQRAACERFVEKKAEEGWKVVGVFEDGGISGKDQNRPGWQQLLKLVEAGGVDKVIVYRTDRAFRSRTDFFTTLEHWLKINVHLISITEPFTLDTAFGRAMAGIIAIVNQLERELTGERIKDNISERFQQGMYTGGLAPFGYYVDRSDPNHKRLVVDEPAAELIRYAFLRYRECQSLTTICDEFKEQGKQQFARRGQENVIVSEGPIEPPHVRRWLRNPTYKGVLYNIESGEQVDGEHRAIITPEDWDATQAAIAKNRQARKTCSKVALHGTLKGLAWCGECGLRMRLTYAKPKGKQHRYYVCPSVVRKRESACTRRYYPADRLEEAALDYLRKIFRSPEVCAAALREIRSKREDALKAAASMLKDIQVRVKDAEDKLAKKVSSSDPKVDLKESTRVEAELDHLHSQQRKVEAELKSLKRLQITDRRVVEHLDNVDQLWDLMEKPLQEELVSLLLASVHVYDGKLKFQLLVNGIQSIVDSLQAGSATATANPICDDHNLEEAEDEVAAN